MIRTARLVAALALALPLAAPAARAEDFLFPIYGPGIDQAQGRDVGPYYYGADGSVGSGIGELQYHTIVTYQPFDLGAVDGPITGLTLTGSVTNLRHILIQDPYLTYNTRLEVVVTNPNPPAAADASLADLFAAVGGGKEVATFEVDNGIPNDPGMTTLGPDFRVSLGPEVVAAAEAAREAGTPFALGFESTGLSYNQSVEGDLSATLDVRAVPEPTSALLLGLGGVAMAVRMCRASARRRAARP